MSTWTSVAASFRQARAAVLQQHTGWWSDSPVEDLALNVVVEGRILDALHPGQVSADGHSFSGPSGGNYYQGMMFAPPRGGWEDLTVPASKWTEAGWWGWGDYGFGKMLDAGLPRGYYDVLTQMLQVFHKAQDSLPFVPSGTWQRWYAALRAGGLPSMISAGHLRATGRLPEWLQSPYHQQAWDIVRNGVLALNRQVTDRNAAQVAAEAAKVAQDLQFWDTVAKWSGAELIEQQFEKLKQAVRDFNAQKEATDIAITQMDRLIAETPDAFSDEQKAAVADLKQRSRSNSQKARAVLDGPIMSALLSEGYTVQGLGIVPAVLIPLGVTAIAGAVASFLGYISIQAIVTDRSNSRLHELAMTREEYDNQQFAAKQQALQDRRSELDTLLSENKLAPDEYERQMAALEQQAKAAGIELLKRRQQSSEAVQIYNDNLKQNQDPTGEGFFSGFGNIAMWGALGAVAIFVVPRLLPTKK